MAQGESTAPELAPPGAERAPSPQPLAYTPAHLADKILKNRAALEGERRTVTVLFCDVAGYTAMSEKLDEETVFAAMQGFIARMLEAVHAEEGTVNQFLGDGIMAIFGAPVSHEDDARRAVAAALRIQATMQELGVACRIGINTGPVVIGRIGDNLRMDYTAVGDTTNLASRLEKLAEPGSVLISETTCRRVRDFFDCEAIGDLEVKGKADPVRAFRAVRARGVHSRFEAAEQRGLSPLVGRLHELDQLTGLVNRAVSGQGQVVAISGEPGLGKSRLILELRRRLPENVLWREGHCSAYGRSVPYLPVAEILKGLFGITENDSPAEIVARIDRVLGERDQGAIAPYLKFLLLVDPGNEEVESADPQLRRAGILDALRTLVAARSELGPMVLVVEDVHWIDPLSEEALLALIDAVAAAPVLLLLSYRPGYTGPLSERSNINRLALTRLHQDEAEALSEAVLGRGRLPRAVADLVAARSDGNPFFVEEVTQTLMESGHLREENGRLELVGSIQDVATPGTIQEVIHARIDRLQEEPRRALQLASVIGREFTVTLLERISDIQARLDSTLQDLKALELIHEKSFFPELAYMFKHALTHEVAYSTLLLERRRTLHHLVATAIEALYPDRLAEHYELLAHHYQEAQVWPKAREFSLRSAEKATAAFAYSQAVEFYSRALEICQREGESTAGLEICQALFPLQVTMSDLRAAGVTATVWLELGERSGRQDAMAWALASRSLAEFLLHQFEAGQASADRALELALASQDPEALAQAHLMMAFHPLVLEGSIPMARDHLRSYEALLPHVRGDLGFGFGGEIAPLVEEWRGDYDSALAKCQRWRELAEDRPRRLSSALLASDWTMGLVQVCRGEYTEGIATLVSCIEDCERIGESWTRTRALNTLGWAHQELYGFELGIRFNEMGLAIARVIADSEVICNPLLNLADIHLAQGHQEEAERCLQEVAAVVNNPTPEQRWMLWRYTQHFHHSLGELRLAQGSPEAALEAADRCLELAQSSNSPKNEVKARRLRGQALEARGEAGPAAGEYEQALSLARGLGNPPQIWKTLAAMGRAGEALEVIDRVAGSLQDPALRDTLLGSDPVQRLRSIA